MDPKKPTFIKGPFQAELRRRVDAYFETSGVGRRDSARMYLKIATIFAWFFASWGFLVFYASTWWMAVPAAISLGLAMAGIGFNIGHDGGHAAVSESKVVNKMMAMSFDFMGASSYMWSWKHNVVHHSYPNIDGVDDDIAFGVMARVTPEQKLRSYQRYQHLYMWFVLTLLAPKWLILDDIMALFTRKISIQRLPPIKPFDLATTLGGKLFFCVWAVVIPLLVGHSWWQILLMYWVMSATLGFTLGTVFQLAHCVGEASFPRPDPTTGAVGHEWAVHQIETAVDFARDSRMVNWYVGGLNFQIEHHLFPQICHVHYPAVARIVETLCGEMGVRYTAHPTIWRALAAHFRWLHKMGQTPAALPEALPIAP